MARNSTGVAGNFDLDVSRGKVPGVGLVNKFGEAPSGIQVTSTDIWDRADATPTQQIWLAPTDARIHTIASSSTEDDTGGNGVDTVIVSYLPDWDSVETTETITGDLNAGIAMGEAAVIIHRIVCVAQATTVGGNTGTITATAATDSTITAIVLPTNMQTEMAIYGVPSTQKFYLTRRGGGIDKTTGTVASADFHLIVNDNPDVQTTNFTRKSDISVQSTGTNTFDRYYKSHPCYAGPCIIKIQATASTADVDGLGNFEGYLVNN